MEIALWFYQTTMDRTPPALPTTAVIPFGFKGTSEARCVQNDLEKEKTDLVNLLAVSGQAKTYICAIRRDPMGYK